jgi:hypothetical protein
MKQASFSAPVLLLATCALLIASANQSVNAHDNNSSNRSGAIFATSAADGGRLFIKRSPVLGRNVAITLTIDGKLAGTLMWWHTYDRYIAPGRHILTVSPNRLFGGPWQAMLDVRPGQTYYYIASYNVNKLVLTPVTGSR